jgi:hypothetical protein
MSSEIFEVVASCSNTAEEFFASIYGTVCAPQWCGFLPAGLVRLPEWDHSGSQRPK